MRKVIYICDKCGKEITEEGTVIAHFTPGTQLSINALMRADDKSVMLCANCEEKTMRWLAEVKEDPEEEKEDPKEVKASPKEIKTSPKEVKENSKKAKLYIPTPEVEKRKEVDDGKILALWKAGWTQKAIADEIGVVPSVISMHIKKLTK